MATPRYDPRWTLEFFGGGTPEGVLKGVPDPGVCKKDMEVHLGNVEFLEQTP